MALLAPSILSADFARLEAEVKMVETAGAGMIHVDVMDGHFAPNITIGPVVVKSVRKITNLPLDVHMMVEKPEAHLDAFVDAGADLISFHREAVKNPHQIVRRLKDGKVSVGLALNPSTPLTRLSGIIQDLDYVLIMSVDPGFPGQKFVEGTEKKIADLKDWIEKEGLLIKIQVDGGIKEENIRNIKQAGADFIVAGSSVFGSLEPGETVRKMVRWIKE
jgi:ribulose-phosphate 3-epimerase